MKSNYLANGSDFRKAYYDIAKEAIENEKRTVCPVCEKSIGDQVLAVVLKVLNMEYGFGKARLQKVIDSTEGLFQLCAKDGRKYQATQCIDWLREIGIDLEKGSESGDTR